MFDAIAYQKTAAVLRMVESYVGPESFRKGIQSYLKKFSYGNAAGEDFWNEVARVTGKPVDRIMAFRYLLQAYDLPPGSEVIIPALTFWAVPEIVRGLGLRPVFADVEPDTFTLSPRAFEAAITERTRMDG